MLGGVERSLRLSVCSPNSPDDGCVGLICIIVYIECKGDTRKAAKKGADEVAADLENEWFRPFETGLKKPQ